ncbi:MAG: NADPH-dependent assimilatory sulfite reductase hemoprotein subunit [Zavarzinella sp.]
MTNETENTPPEPKLSPVEGIKSASRWLRGPLMDELQQDTDHFSEDAKQLLKFHGSYQQEDRDARKNRSKEGVGKHYMFMIRLKLPGGTMTGAQYLAMDEIADRHANGSLRLTTRQSIQFYGILKSNLRQTIRDMNDALISTVGACGDINRNVVACSAPLGDQPRKENQRLALEIAAHLAPRSKAYHDVWLNGEKVSPDAEQEDVEPIYGKVYLPRKFKIAMGLPHDNCVDLFAQDLGFLAHIEGGQVTGYNVSVGGGFGRTAGKAETFPHLGQMLCHVSPDEVVATAEAVVKFYRDHGNRADRKRARIKYVVHDWGIDKVREVIARDYLPHTLRMPKEYAITGVDLHHGWQPQGDGKWFLGLSIASGRIKDEGNYRLRSGLRKIVQDYRANVNITTQQDLILADLDPAHRGAIDQLLVEYGIPRPESLPLLHRWSMACPAIPTCGLAISESERALPQILDEFQSTLVELGLEEEAISIRMTGCPNGCARPYNSDIGLVGRSGEKYTVFVGGGIAGDRLNFVLQDLVPRGNIVPNLKKLFVAYKSQRQNNEGFGTWCTRTSLEELQAMFNA